MLLIRRLTAIILLVLTAVSIASMAISAFIIISAPGSDELRFQAEKVLFIGIILVCIVSAAFITVFIKSRNINRDLEKLIRQNRLNPEATGPGLLKLGETGRKLNSLYQQIDEVSRKRGLKIGALSEANEFLSRNISEPVLLIDVSGRIIQVSRGYLELHGLRRSDIIDQDLPLLADSEMQLGSILSQLERKHLPVETDIDGKTYRWSPLFNAENEINYLAVVQLSDKPN